MGQHVPGLPVSGGSRQVLLALWLDGVSSVVTHHCSCLVGYRLRVALSLFKD
jgi:hypothetical protein